MLVLSRRVGESVVIGDEVVVTVLEVRGDMVRVGIDAPRHVSVHRRELLDELVETNRAAASPDQAAVTGLSRLLSAGPPGGTSPAPDPDRPSGPASA